MNFYNYKGKEEGGLRLWIFRGVGCDWGAGNGSRSVAGSSCGESQSRTFLNEIGSDFVVGIRGIDNEQQHFSMPMSADKIRECCVGDDLTQ